MKTKTIALAAALLSTFTYASAQEDVGQTVIIQEINEDASPQPLPRVIWGIKGEIGAELPSGSWTLNNEKRHIFNSGFEASAGAVANIFLGKNFFFEPGINIFYKGYSYNNMMAVAPNSPSVNGGPTIHKVGANVPLIFGYYINISETWGISVFTGPQLGYAFYGTAKSDNETVKQNYDLMHVFKGVNAQSRFDASWKIGIGFPVNDFLISLEGNIGMNNMMKGANKMRENSLMLGVTYYFVP